MPHIAPDRRGIWFMGSGAVRVVISQDRIVHRIENLVNLSRIHSNNGWLEVAQVSIQT